ncbi:MAG: tetratricopeptide repeat protein, partial [Muribaculaceae bacterium]|nr:tetratricopeptide repeat protein [Muribaculaceae bacterium]
MRGLLCVILTAVVLVAVVTGCGGARHYDGRLVAADSLMHDRPDSALALVEAVSADSLDGDGDRAYRDLLLTQARYRCYVPATSDSAINRALAYYLAHDGEREKLTRAYIYKGAVMEEL